MFPLKSRFFRELVALWGPFITHPEQMATGGEIPGDQCNIGLLSAGKAKHTLQSLLHFDNERLCCLPENHTPGPQSPFAHLSLSLSLSE